jgi:hypothetical protein
MGGSRLSVKVEGGERAAGARGPLGRGGGEQAARWLERRERRPARLGRKEGKRKEEKKKRVGRAQREIEGEK